MLLYLPLALTAAAFALHLLGERIAVIVTGRPRSRAARTRAMLFYAGLLTILIALGTPIDSLAQKLFWVHMIQHVLLLTVAPPLIVMGAPWMSIWRPLPLNFRRTLARTVVRSPRLAPLRAACRWLFSPLGAWLAFSVNLVGWHVPAVYDLALQSAAVHALEHLLYMTTGILLWAQVIDSPPLRAHVAFAQRAYYMLAAMVVGWVLSLVLVFATAPLYPVYAHLANRPGGISALTDQQLAAGVMLVPGSLTMTVFIFVVLYQWLGSGDESERPRRRTHALSGDGRAL